MKRKELNELKAKIAENKGKAADIDVIMEKLLLLPPGQLKKIFTDEVLAVLAKYGYTE